MGRECDSVLTVARELCNKGHPRYGVLLPHERIRAGAGEFTHYLSQSYLKKPYFWFNYKSK